MKKRKSEVRERGFKCIFRLSQNSDAPNSRQTLWASQRAWILGQAMKLYRSTWNFFVRVLTFACQIFFSPLVSMLNPFFRWFSRQGLAWKSEKNSSSSINNAKCILGRQIFMVLNPFTLVFNATSIFDLKICHVSKSLLPSKAYDKIDFHLEFTWIRRSHYWCIGNIWLFKMGSHWMIEATLESWHFFDPCSRIWEIFYFQTLNLYIFLRKNIYNIWSWCDFGSFNLFPAEVWGTRGQSWGSPMI